MTKPQATRPLLTVKFKDISDYAPLPIRATRMFTPPPWPRQSDQYNGAELRPFSARPGAMDAYALPSLVAGVRVPRTAPICAPTSSKTTSSTHYS